MNDPIIATRAINEQEKLLRQKFYEAIVTQSDLLDKVAERLLTLELAIPGLYATALSVTHGKDAKLVLGSAVYLSFACWLLALLLTLCAIIPRTRHVDTTLFKQDPRKFAESWGLEDFFTQSARYKRRLVVTSCLLFFAGIFCAVLNLGLIP